MEKKQLLEKLSLLGFPMFEAEEELEANEVLAEVVKSKNSRLFEGFPVLLANTFEKALFKLNTVNLYFKTSNDKATFYHLTAMSYALYLYLELKPSWLDKLKSVVFSFPLTENSAEKYLQEFRHSQNLTGSFKNLSRDRVVKTFKRYFNQQEVDLKNYTELSEDFKLEYSLSQLFSKKQKELFLKKLRKEKMTKTEREYYSRTVRKKVQALANDKLYNMAVKIVKG
ncbi:MAG: hypothetical protein KAS46_05545 [Candidatus Aureabacteria bacterium]|nr:hypothetical protein [Candidatus Auribacterota bacterium]